jgi:hypothetical protein
MSRIVDITDLVDDSSSDGSDGDCGGVVGHSSGLGAVGGRPAPGGGRDPGAPPPPSSRIPRGGGGGRRAPYAPPPAGAAARVGCRQALILSSLVAIIAGASIAIGYAVVGSPPPSSSSSSSSSSSASGNMAYLDSGGDGRGGEQKLLEIAERVVVACSESALDADMSDCRALCRESMCCFQEDDDGDAKYSCADDGSRNCAVYAGCSNLMDGVPLGAAEEGEE